VVGRRTFRSLLEVQTTGELLGLAEAASQGVVTAERMERLPLRRVSDLLEQVPGLIVSQHGGDGKANQYYLRGFNLDHGTDLAVFVADVPVNLPTHAHGQGYADINFRIAPSKTP
jgi:outer membrane cobalamin receptor